MAFQRGFTYLGLLFAIAFLGLMFAGTGEVWQRAAQREREEQLLFAGRAYARAIAAYHAATPGDVKQWPRKLEDLAVDRRNFATRHHLRQLYPDPMSDNTEWGLIKTGEGIVGVYSMAEGKPLKQANFLESESSFAGANSYGEWRFLALAQGKDELR
jgi:type II secretory pathway pseudopilin PulG